MARPGVTYAKVADAATQLLGQGRNPTIEQVRLILGTGSSTTLANHLKQWKETQESAGRLAIKENLPHELVSMVKGLWERVVGQSEEQVAVIEEHHQQSITEVRQELEKYKNNNRRWQRLFNDWVQEKNLLVTDKITLQQALESAQKKKDEHFNTSQHWQTQYKELQTMLNEKINYFIDIQSENKLLLQKIIDLKQEIVRLQEQNKLPASIDLTPYSSVEA